MPGVEPPSQEDLAGSLEVIVLDSEGARPVPTANRLRVEANPFDVGDMRSSDVGRGAVERDPALLTERWITVDVAPIDRQIPWHLGKIGLRSRSVAKPDDVAVALCSGSDLEQLEPPAARAGGRAECRTAIAGPQLGESWCVFGAYPLTGQWQLVIGKRCGS